MAYYAVSMAGDRKYVVVHRFGTMQERNKWANSKKNRVSLRSDSPIVGRAMEKRDKFGYPMLSVSPQRVFTIEQEMDFLKKEMELERYLKKKDNVVDGMDDASSYMEYKKKER